MYPRQFRSSTCQNVAICFKNSEVRAFRWTWLAAFTWLFIEEQTIINIQNDDERCFGYALLYFFERANLPEQHCFRVTLYKEKLFQRHHLDTLYHSISPNDVHLYEDQLMININVFFFFDEEGRAWHPLVISRKNHERVANLCYWKNHCAPITSIPRLFSDNTKHNPQKHFRYRCLNHILLENVIARHMELCTRNDFMSVLHVLTVPGSKQADIKFNQYKCYTKAPFIINADFEFIFELSSRQLKHTTYTQQHKVCAAAAILTSNFYNFDQRTVMKVVANALAEFIDALIMWKAEIIAILSTNRAIKRLSARQQEEYDNAARCYICRNEFVVNEAKGPKVCDHEYITG